MKAWRNVLAMWMTTALATTGIAAPLPPSKGALVAAGPSQGEVIANVAGMVNDPEAQALAQKHGLQILNVLWEDTGRWQGSSVGPNISDVTLEVVDDTGGQKHSALMPVIRPPNFTDKTADVKLDRFYLRVGNQHEGARDEVISLKALLENPTRYLSAPTNGKIRGGSLLASRDTHALISAQAAFLPVPQGGKATFYPVIFNYQSTAKNPAVLTILVTRQGTSMTIVDNTRDTVSGGASWGQRLFFNAGGQRAPLTAERLSDVQSSGKTSNGEAASTLGADANLLMLIQVPLKYREPARMGFKGMSDLSMPMAAMGAPAPEKSARKPDMEVAVLGHGELEGPYTELDGLTLERDGRFPVRVTVQFYQATSQAHIGEANLTRLAQQINGVFAKGDAVGSLVVPSPSDLQRPTNWDGVTTRPTNASFWSFPGLVERWFMYGNGGPDRVGIR
jgi:hypothetical protein